MDFSYRLNANGGPWVDFTVTAIAGHLTTQDFPAEFRKWHSCEPFALFDAPIVTKIADGDATGMAQNLEREARHAQELMIWTDCDREGEHIGSEVAAVCGKVNRNIRVTRARFSAIIPQQIHAAARNTVQLDMAQAHAVETRMILDLRTGAAFTRLQTLGLQHALPILDSVISYGSCQFPTLGFVVEQYHKVQNFVSEPFWYIHVMLERDDFKVEFKWKRNRLFDQQAAVVVYEVCLQNPEATVTAVINKPTTKWKPWPLTTVELQKAGSRLLRMTPKKVLETAEALYQRGFLSYPRTETDQFDPQFNFHELIERQRNDPAWGAYASMLLDQGGYERPKNGKKNDKAHPPIHPVQHAGNLAGDEKKVYEFVTRRYLACCSRNAQGDSTTIEAKIAEEIFTATGLIVRQRNYLDVYVYDKWNGNQLPPFQQNETFVPTVLDLNEGHTTRPNLLTEADLVTLMDKNGIGTDATIAEHIAKIIERQYVMKQREGRFDYLVPSTLGIGLVEGYSRMNFDKSLCKPHLRAETEVRMSAICDGERTKNDVLQETVDEYREVFLKSKQNLGLLINTVREYIEGNGNAAPAEGVVGHNGPGSDDEFWDDGDDDDEGGGGNGGANAGGRGRGQARGGRGGRGAPAGRGNAPRGRGSGPTAGRGGGPPRNPPRNGFLDDDDEDNDENRPAGGPSCRCDLPAVERASTQARSMGRKFWACPKPREEGCGFFDWQNGQGNNNNTNGQQQQRRSAAQLVGGVKLGEAPRCMCDLVAAGRVCQNDKNPNRPYFACSKQSGKCKFFEWADESAVAIQDQPQRQQRKPLSAASTNWQRDGGQDAGAGAGACYSCGESGHYSNACPQKGGGGGGGGYNPGNNAGPSRNKDLDECYKCHESGHWSSECPNSGDGGGGNAGGGYNAGASRSKDTDECYKCHQTGHWSSACPNAGDSGGGGGGYSKSGRSNYSKNNNNNADGESGYSCFKCGEPGHFANNCPNDEGGGGGGGSKRSRSYSRGGPSKRARRGGSRGRGRGRGGSKRGRGARGGSARQAVGMYEAPEDDFGGDDYGGYDEYE